MSPIPLFWFPILPFWRRAEIQAAKYLRAQGYRIVASGFRVKEGEVDLVAWDGGVLVFIEVKSRKGTDPPEAAVGYTKQQRIVKAARLYIGRYKHHEAFYRFDVVAINEIPGQKLNCRLIRNAFTP